MNSAVWVFVSRPVLESNAKQTNDVLTGVVSRNPVFLLASPVRRVTHKEDVALPILAVASPVEKGVFASWDNVLTLPVRAFVVLLNKSVKRGSV